MFPDVKRFQTITKSEILHYIVISYLKKLHRKVIDSFEQVIALWASYHQNNDKLFSNMLEGVLYTYGKMTDEDDNVLSTIRFNILDKMEQETINDVIYIPSVSELTLQSERLLLLKTRLSCIFECKCSSIRLSSNSSHFLHTLSLHNAIWKISIFLS